MHFLQLVFAFNSCQRKFLVQKNNSCKKHEFHWSNLLISTPFFRIEIWLWRRSRFRSWGIFRRKSSWFQLQQSQIFNSKFRSWLSRRNRFEVDSVHLGSVQQSQHFGSIEWIFQVFFHGLKSTQFFDSNRFVLKFKTIFTNFKRFHKCSVVKKRLDRFVTIKQFEFEQKKLHFGSRAKEENFAEEKILDAHSKVWLLSTQRRREIATEISKIEKHESKAELFLLK